MISCSMRIVMVVFEQRTLNHSLAEVRGFILSIPRHDFDKCNILFNQQQSNAYLNTIQSAITACMKL